MNTTYNIENEEIVVSLSSIHSESSSTQRAQISSADDESDEPSDPYESVPDVLDSTSVKSDDEDDSDDDDDDDEEEEDDDDLFDLEGLPMPRLSSSTIPIAMEVIRPSHTGMYKSEDPLFQGVCLYHSGSSNEKPSDHHHRAEATKSKAPPRENKHQLTHSWVFPAMFQHLLDMRQQRVTE
mmetsp:Transcript_118074/g.176413  ORF Transcript_118074/g.176413 Transcript_118074/m.176413 type:complete len:181 (+) Transcript_118074:303-845(+)|eukprot:CAMPEP_0117017776 /NCGR_PEP_ID=MMETSP0472-20121206/13832_1 /TAXON_ID=693140 ORGANISM="Tiarina fusus, Strain LIS" /NCGR_SAMPLE_ID=MMETSP0472 /ASSEMBLY_ACC=CAM_ASM_000603 /LENGTH=180 /DNA_ID=CAMNT_0004722235 /DNA_START=283 /DNA_END=825 /DNA_ORIENTATION=-